MRWPRMTVRRLMVLVAFAGSSFGVARMVKVRHHRLDEAALHEGIRSRISRTPADIQYWEARWTDQRWGKPASYPWPAGPPFVPAIAAYHDAMRVKWERAARTPWLPVDLDPPE